MNGHDNWRLVRYYLTEFTDIVGTAKFGFIKYKNGRKVMV